MEKTIVAALKPPPCSEAIYPFAELQPKDGYPLAADFEIIHTSDGRGMGVRTRNPLQRGRLVCRVSGYVVTERRLHTLQITGKSHLYDPYFTGLLLHSCDPNVFLDMAEFELWAIKDIPAGELLLMDYASTEDVLMRQFECHCGATNCRGWITGAKERANEAGAAFLARKGIALF